MAPARPAVDEVVSLGAVFTSRCVNDGSSRHVRMENT